MFDLIMQDGLGSHRDNLDLNLPSNLGFLYVPLNFLKQTQQGNCTIDTLPDEPHTIRLSQSTLHIHLFGTLSLQRKLILAALLAL